MTLQAQLDHLRAEFGKTTAPEIQSVMHRATTDLLQSGIMDRVLKAGDAAPFFHWRPRTGNGSAPKPYCLKGRW